MGRTIHYAGRLHGVELIDGLVAEVAGVAETVGWSYQAIDDGTLRGMVLGVHEDCEPVALLADRNGVLRYPLEDLDDDSRRVFVKTQYAPVDVHFAIVKLLGHLRERYFAELAVEDESGCCETGDRWEFVKHHPCVSVLTDRYLSVPVDLESPWRDVIGGDLIERLEGALANAKGDSPHLREVERDARDHGGRDVL